MKFKNHTTIALAIGIAANAPLPALFGISIGSVFPDKLDMALSGGSERLFFKVHRGFSHWPWNYIIIFATILFWPGVIQTIWGQFFMGIASGAALHVLGDMFTIGGVPYLPYSLKKKFGFKLFKTGSFKEYMYTWGIVALCAGCIVARYYITGRIPLFHYQQTIAQLVSMATKAGNWIIGIL